MVNTLFRPKYYRKSFSQSDGPGGQNVNRTQTRATVFWEFEAESLPDGVKSRLRSQRANQINSDGEIVVSSSETRSQSRNLENCLDRIQEWVQIASKPPKKRVKTKPSRAAKRKRLDDKKRRSEKKSLRRKPE